MRAFFWRPSLKIGLKPVNTFFFRKLNPWKWKRIKVCVCMCWSKEDLQMICTVYTIEKFGQKRKLWVEKQDVVATYPYLHNWKNGNLKVPKWPRSLECYFPVLVIWGFDHMLLVIPKMFSSGFRAREMRSLLGEALAIFVACCSSLWSH